MGDYKADRAAVESLLRLDSEPFFLALANALHAEGAPLLRSDKIANALGRAALAVIAAPTSRECDACGMPADRCATVPERSSGAWLNCCDNCTHIPPGSPEARP